MNGSNQKLTVNGADHVVAEKEEQNLEEEQDVEIGDAARKDDLIVDSEKEQTSAAKEKERKNTSNYEDYEEAESSLKKNGRMVVRLGKPKHAFTVHRSKFEVCEWDENE